MTTPTTSTSEIQTRITNNQEVAFLNGHYYLFVWQNNSTIWFWDADAAAQAYTYNNTIGHLASITSPAENDFIFQKTDGTININVTTFLSGVQSSGNFVWLQETPTSSPTFWNGHSGGSAATGMYTNFASGEPNDHKGGEDWVVMLNTGQWNDGTDYAPAYVVEWDGTQYDIGFSTNGLEAPTNAQRGSTTSNSSYGTVRINLNRPVLGNFAYDKPLVAIPITFSGLATLDKDYTVDINPDPNQASNLTRHALASFSSPTTNPFGLPTVQTSNGTTTGTAGIIQPLLVDIDGDSDLDMVTGTYGGATLFYRNTGSVSSPHFAGSSSIGLPDVGGYSSPSLVDIDGDGDKDAFIGNSLGNTIFFRNTGSFAVPFFSASASSGLPDVGNYASPTFVDIDKDGDFDAFIGNVSGQIYFYKNNGSTSAPLFAAGVLNPFGIVGSVDGLLVAPRFFDIDNDQDLDLFIGHGDGNTLFFRNTGTINLASFAPSSVAFGQSNLGLYNAGVADNLAPTFGDIDHDGDLDAFIGNNAGNFIYQRNDSTDILYVKASGAATSVDHVTLRIKPIGDNEYKRQEPQDVKITLGSDIGVSFRNDSTGGGSTSPHHIYSLNTTTAYPYGSSSSQQLWIIDDEPTLSLGQGLYQKIYTNYATSGTDTLDTVKESTTLFDVNGINETDGTGGTFTALGLNDNFGIRWEGYIRIPQTGSYSFQTIGNDGTNLTLKHNNKNGTEIITSSGWLSTFSIGNIQLNAGDVVWLQMDYFENKGAAVAQLNWQPPGSTTYQVIPGSALFLSEAEARGHALQEPLSGSATGTAFTTYANQASSASLNLNYSLSTGSGYAQFRPPGSGSVVGDDYAIYTDSAAIQNQLPATGSSTSTPTSTAIGWTPTGSSPSKDLYYRVYQDSYAEGNETTQFTLNAGTGYGVASSSNTSTILDRAVTLSIDPLPANPSQGQAGWVKEGALNSSGQPDPGWITIKSSIDQSFYAASAGAYGLPSQLGAYASPSFVDIDNDNDLDAFVGVVNGNTLFFQNTGTRNSPAFAPSSVNAYGLSSVTYTAKPSFVDIDNDGDLDAFIGSNNSGKISFFRNTGTLTSPHFVLTTNSFGLTNVNGDAAPTFVDIDGDLDLDAFIGDDAKISYFQNTGTRSNAQFASAVTSFFGLSISGSVLTPTFTDIDNDGDKDLFVGTYQGSTLFYRNTGSNTSPAFAGSIASGLPTVNGYAAPALVDIDADGDPDAFIGSNNGNTIYSQGPGYRSTPWLPVYYQINSGTATRDTDYFTPKGTLSTTTYSADNIVYLAPDASETKLYISPMADAIHEATETINLQIVTHTNTDADGRTSQSYGVNANNSSASINLLDSGIWTPGVAITPPYRTGTATIRATTDSNNSQQAVADVHLLSQPQGNVTVTLSSTSGTFVGQSSLVFTASNWDTAQSVTITGLSPTAATTLTATTSSSADSYYGNKTATQTIVPSNWSSDLSLTLWENGPLQPVIPNISLIADHGVEDGDEFGFDLKIDKTRIDSGLEIFYTLTAGAGFDLSGSTADVVASPDRTYKPLTLTSSNNSYASLGSLNTVGASGAFSAEAWVRPDSTPTADAAILDFSDGAGINEILFGFSSGTLKPMLKVFNSQGTSIGTLTATHTLNSGEWNHLAFSIDSSLNVSLYVNGAKIETDSATGSLSQAPVSKVRSHNWVGRDNATTSYLNAAVRDVRVWNTDRPQQEIKASMLDVEASGSGLMGAWTFNNATANPGANRIPQLSFSGSSAGAFGLANQMGANASPSFADIDGDGDKDAFIGTSNGNTIFFKNTGTANSPVFAASSANPFGLTNIGTNAIPSFVDIDADGDLDAFIGNHNGSTLYFRNTGTSSTAHFAGSSIAFNLTNVNNDAAPTFVDIDGDGDQDAFIGDSVKLNFFRNTGTSISPSFASAVTNAYGLTVSGSLLKPAFDDVDKDGDFDLFVGTSQGSTLFYRNTGNRTAPGFAASSNAFGLPSVNGNAAPVLVDIDNDSDPDAFIGSSGGSVVYSRADIDLSNGDQATNATLSGGAAYATTATYGAIIEIEDDIASVRFTPIDDDRHESTETITLNLVGSSNYTKSTTSSNANLSDNDTPAVLFSLLSPNGAWSLTPDLLVNENGNVTGTTTVVGLSLATQPTADVTITLTSASINSINTKLLINGGNTSPRLTFTTSNWNVEQQVTFQGVDNNVYADDTPPSPSSNLVFGISSTDTNYSSLSPAITVTILDDDEFRANPVFTDDSPSSGPIVSFSAPSATTLTEGSTSSSVITIALSQVNTSNDTLVFYDLDTTYGDVTVNDIRITSAASTRAGLRRLQTPSGGTETAVVDSDGINENGASLNAMGVIPGPAYSGTSTNFGIPAQARLARPALVDIDDDGKTDLFIGYNNGTTLYFHNTGSSSNAAFAASSMGAFGLPVSQGGYASPTFVDIDADGDQDAFIGNNGSILFYRNTGSASRAAFSPLSQGAFGLPPVATGDLEYVQASSFVDIDGDGDQDAFIGSNTGITLFFQNTGTKSVAAFAGSSHAFGPTAISAPVTSFADIDHDDDFDAFIGIAYGNILFYPNTGTISSPQFASPVTNPFGISSVQGDAAPAFADMDADGDLDLFVGNSNGSTLYFANTLAAPGTVTWSGWVKIDETGSYTFKTPVQGGVRLKIDNNVLINEWYDTKNTWASDQQYYEEGSYLAIQLDYLPTTSQESKIALNWQRPGNNGVGYVDELVPADHLQRVDGLYVVIPANSLSVNLNIQAVSDSLAEGKPGTTNRSEALQLNLLDTRGVELIVNGQSSGALTLGVNRTFQESLTLPAGTVLNLGPDDSSTSSSLTSTVASFTLTQSVTLHRDRSSNVSGTLHNPAGLAYSGSVVGMVSSYSFVSASGAAPYQVQDPGVTVKAMGDWLPSNFSTSSSGLFGLPSSINGYTHPTFVDIDADGDQDAFIGSGSASITIFYKNTGSSTHASFAASSNGAFGLPTNTGILPKPSFVDIDGDGDFDAFIGFRDGNNISHLAYYQNTGNKSIAQFAGSSNPFGITSLAGVPGIAFNDIDDDGDFDAFIGTDAGNILYYKNTGSDTNPSFASPSTNPFGITKVAGGDFDPTFVDIDQDGDQDLFVGNSLSGNTSSVIYYFKNTGSSSSPGFAAATQNPYGLPHATSGIASPAFADINGDGAQDAFIGYANGHLLYFQGNASVNLALTTTNRSSVTLPTGTVLQYTKTANDGSISPYLDLTLTADLTLQAPTGSATTGPSHAAKASVRAYAGSTAITDMETVVDIDSPAKINIQDNNTPGVLISGGSTTAISLSEQGQSVQRSIQLTSMPRQESVTVYLETNDDSEVMMLANTDSGSSAVNRLTLNFTPENWSQPQSFWIQPQDDSLDDGTISAAIKTRTASNDAFYNIADTGQVVNVTVADDDSSSVLVSLVTSTVTRGGNGFLRVVLTAQPLDDVTITLKPSDLQFTIEDRGIGRPETLTFTPDDWSVAQQVELRAVDDQDAEDVTRSSLTFTTTSLDKPFDQLTIAPVTIDIVDNDVPTASILLGTNSTEEAAPGSFRIQLSSPAPSSVGSDGVVVSYTISSLRLDPGLGYGDFDAFIGNNAGNTLFFQNNGTVNSVPAFAGSTIAFGLPAVGALARPSFVDIDADGDLDAFIGNQAGYTLFFKNNGSTASAAFVASVSGAYGLQANVGADASPSFVDIDADGDFDAFIGNQAGSTLFFQNIGSTGSAAFAASVTGAFGLPANGGASPTFVDIDSDGDFDAFIGTSSGSTLFFRNTGSISSAAFAASSVGVFGLTGAIGTWVVPSFVDIDHDSDLDAFIGSSNGNSYFYKNNGTRYAPSFGTASLGAYGLSSAGTYAAPTFVDIDGDYPSSTLSKIVQLPLATGQVRIAPGQTTSDVFVIPIDDYLADTTDKQFVVTLSSGTGYQLTTGAASSSATVKIINNDKAGMAIITSGLRPLVYEGSTSGGQFQVALLSQPSSNVQITLNEYGGANQLSSLGNHLNFNSDNWYIPQTVTFMAPEDHKIAVQNGMQNGTSVGYELEDPNRPNSGTQTATITFTFNSQDTHYNSASHTSDSTYFTNATQLVDVQDTLLPSSTATSIQNSLTSLQEGIESLSLPLVGSLDGKVGSGFRKFLNKLVESVRDVETPTPNQLKKLIADGIGILQDNVTLAMDGTNIKIGFLFTDEEKLFSVPLAADFGIPALGFKSDGSLDAGYGYTAKLTLGINPLSTDTSTNIWLDTDPENTYVSASYTTSLSEDFSFTGGLGFLQMEAVNQPTVNETIITANDGDAPSTDLIAAFHLDLHGGAGSDGKLTIAELTNGDLDFENLFQYSLSGRADLSLGITTSIAGSAAVPSFSFDLASSLPLFDYSNQEETTESTSATSIYFDNIRLDLGTYVTGMLKPIVDGIDNVINPLYPIVDALYADTHIFSSLGLVSAFDHDEDGYVSSLDLAYWFADFYSLIDPVKGEKLLASVVDTIEFLGIIREVMDLVRTLEEMAQQGSFYVDFGSYQLDAFKLGSTDDDHASDTVDVDANKHGLVSEEEASTAANNGGTDASGNSNSTFQEVMEQLDELGFQIPLVDNPVNAIKLLLGQQVDLFTWRMPDAGMRSEIDEHFPIYEGIEGVIEGEFGVDANIAFGFDTSGLNAWRTDGFKAKDAWKVFNGFYIQDWNDDGVDVPEFSLDATMGAGLGLSAVVVRADIIGGLAAAASFDLLDVGEIAGKSDGKIYGNEIIDRLSHPLDLFELVGDLSAFVKAQVQVGLDMGFYSIWDTVWQKKLANIPIFEFGVGGSYGSGTSSNGYIKGSIVHFDGNRNGLLDSIEPWVITGDDASYHLQIDHRSFDTDRNGTIDDNEGRIMVIGGFDSSIGLSLEIPLLAPFGQMVTPLTTIHALALDLGYSAEAATTWINQAFGLQGYSYSSDDPVLDLTVQTDPIPGGIDAQQAYLAHLKLHFGLDQLLNTLQNLEPSLLDANVPAQLDLMRHVVLALFSQPSDTPINDALANALLRAGDTWLSSHGQEIDERSAVIIQEVVQHAADSIREFGRQLDQVAASVRDSDGPTFLAVVNAHKADSFGHFRTSLSGISESLHLFDQPATLQAEVSDRLEAILSAYAAPEGIDTSGSGVTSSTANGTYTAGSTITIFVPFTEAVTVTGSPTLLLQTGSTSRSAVYSEGSGSSILAFTYTVEAGDSSVDLDVASTSALLLNGGTIKDRFGDNVDLTLPIPGGPGSLGANADLVIDALAPTISATNPADGATGVLESANIQFTFSEAVLAGAGSIQLLRADGSTVETFDVASGAGSAGGSLSINGSSVSLDPYASLLSNTAYTLTISATAFTDAAGNAFAGISDPTSFNFSTGDSIAPTAGAVTSVNADGTYGTGARITLSLRFSEAVTVTGNGALPSLLLETGMIDRSATYTSGSGTDTLTFAYTVQVGDASADLDTAGANALVLGGSTITDGAGNNAVLTLPTPGAPGSLAANAALVISGTIPQSLAISTGTPAVSEGSSISVALSSDTLAAGAPIYWTFSGAGITSGDLSPSELSGSLSLGSDQRAAFSRSISLDGISEGDEQLTLSFFSDANRTVSLGQALFTLRDLVPAAVAGATDGRDQIIGTAADELISGVPTGSILNGRGSYDTLTGNGGNDTYILGTGTSVYYNDAKSNTTGAADLAAITDFNLGDRIQLKGSPADYRLSSGALAGASGSFLHWRAAAGAGSSDETIGFLQGLTPAALSLSNSSQFIYL